MPSAFLSRCRAALGLGWRPEAPALRWPDGQLWSHAELEAAIARQAEDWRAEGLFPGQAVGLPSERPELALVGLLAALELGLCALPLPPEGPQRRAALALARPRLVLGEAAPLAEPRTNLPPELALLILTSGSSGPPKGVMLGQAGLEANVLGILSYLPVQRHPTTALTLPLAYGYALVGQALVTLAAGGCLLWLGGLRYPSEQLEAMARWGAEGLSSVPPALRLLAQSALGGGARPRLAYLASAGAPLDEATRAELAQAFPEAQLFNQYGATEAGPRVSALAIPAKGWRPGQVGKPLPGVRVELRDEAGRLLPPGEEGLVHVHSPALMLGYLDDPEGSAAALGPWGLRTGDWGRLSPDGQLELQGRADGIVKCAGERVSIAEVAGVLQGAEGVAEAGVVALPDPWLGSRLVAFVAPGPGHSAEEAIAAAKAAAKAQLQLAARPRQLRALPVLPKLPGGKMDLAALRALAEAEEQ